MGCRKKTIYQAGSASTDIVPPLSINTNIQVKFIHPFSHVPTVVASIDNTGDLVTAGYVNIAIHNITKSGFQFDAVNTDSFIAADYKINWFAINNVCDHC